MSRNTTKEKYTRLLENEKQIKKAYINGDTARDIGNRMNCTHTYVLRFLRSLDGYEDFKHKTTATGEDIIFILENYDKLPIERICNILKLSKKTVIYEYNRGSPKAGLERERMKFVERVYSRTENKDLCFKRIQKTSKFKTLFQSNEDELLKTIQRYINTRLT